MPLREGVISLDGVHGGQVMDVAILNAAVQVMNVRDYCYVALCTHPGRSSPRLEGAIDVVV